MRGGTLFCKKEGHTGVSTVGQQRTCISSVTPTVTSKTPPNTANNRSNGLPSFASHSPKLPRIHTKVITTMNTNTTVKRNTETYSESV